jgi:hypothetical protein
MIQSKEASFESFRVGCPNGPGCASRHHGNRMKKRTASHEKRIRSSPSKGKKNKQRTLHQKNCQQFLASMQGKPVIAFSRQVEIVPRLA